ncbi:MAG: ferredoxin [Actinobacteria bacterium]|mgnify:CR=1 FL=1|nr:ferredoxin [Actinomycetota bacterium]MCB8997277.1 ferredoxin [Actinomycetota bacterium]MCB9423587.1 ferredoxin [Actinomycetota bacterium]HRY10529.1 ferredoxin [Candidatus Nanopelagicales bacterium]
MSIQIDWRRCQGHGVCAAALGEIIERDESGYPLMKTHNVPEELHSAARLAQATCPAAALRATR